MGGGGGEEFDRGISVEDCIRRGPRGVSSHHRQGHLGPKSKESFCIMIPSFVHSSSDRGSLISFDRSPISFSFLSPHRSVLRTCVDEVGTWDYAVADSRQTHVLHMVDIYQCDSE